MLEICVEPEVVEEDQSAKVMPGEVVIGTLVDVTDKGVPLVDYSGNPAKGLLQALSTVSVDKKSIGRQAALLFQNGDPDKPLIVGLVRNFLDNLAEASDVTEVLDDKPKEVVIDGERVLFTAEKEIVLKCGKASITLTRAGKILIRGAYLSSRSSGTNRIRGGTVHVN